MTSFFTASPLLWWCLCQAGGQQWWSEPAAPVGAAQVTCSHLWHLRGEGSLAVLPLLQRNPRAERAQPSPAPAVPRAEPASSLCSWSLLLVCKKKALEKETNPTHKEIKPALPFCPSSKPPLLPRAKMNLIVPGKGFLPYHGASPRGEGFSP